ncbi:MAG: hydrogenase expression/formation protein HypE [Planctomycetota bacterium]
MSEKYWSKHIAIDKDRVDLSYGAGGRHTMQLIDELFIEAFDNEYLREKNDNAQFPFHGRLVVSTDAHVVSPLFFPGGDIGKLAVSGTINDISVAGAKPVALTASFILEEGFPLSDLKKIVYSMAETARKCGVSIVAGDTKVVEKGKGDGVFITTTGIGIIQQENIQVRPFRARPGDQILINGTIGDHGIAIMSKRENLSFQTDLESDVAPLHELIQQLISAVPDIHCMRDPTRGGVASALNEWALSSQVGMVIDEALIPIRPEVESACEFLGLDPLNVANEGKVLIICEKKHAESLLKIMRLHPLGQEASCIGEVIEDPHHFIRMKTRIGGTRMVHWPSGEELPRIC